MAAQVPLPRAVGGGKVSYSLKGSQLEVDEKYTIQKALGYGAYGFVCAATDKVTGQRCAIKKVAGVFDDLIDGKRVLREVKLLPYLRHPNIMGIVDIMRPRGDQRSFKDLYIVCELMETDLNQVIRSKQRLTEEHHSYFVFQMLAALKYMHAAGVIHRDLKPGNLLVNGSCDLKICDFGLARGGLAAHEPRGLELTDYVVTRWYRPPELLLDCNYAAPVDMWSVGCILCELVNRKPLWAGRDYMHQLQLITDTIGVPSGDGLRNINSEQARRFLGRMPAKRARPWSGVIPSASPNCVALVDRLLTFTPARRATAADALRMPYIGDLYDPEDELEFDPRRTGRVDWSFDARDVREPELRRLFWEEIERYHPAPPAARRASSSSLQPGSRRGSVVSASPLGRTVA